MIVSPFNPSTGKYTFSLKSDIDELCIGVALKENTKPVLKTWFRAKPLPITNWNATKLLIGIPLMTLKVISAIHLEALKLWLKGMRTPRQLRRKNGFHQNSETFNEQERA